MSFDLLHLRSDDSNVCRGQFHCLYKKSRGYKLPGGFQALLTVCFLRYRISPVLFHVHTSSSSSWYSIISKISVHTTSNLPTVAVSTCQQSNIKQNIYLLLIFIYQGECSWSERIDMIIYITCIIKYHCSGSCGIDMLLYYTLRWGYTGSESVNTKILIWQSQMTFL